MALTPKILVIEDEKPLSKILKYNFEKEGYEVLCAFDGQEGLEMFQNRRPNFIILDLMIPKISGMDLLKEIRLKSKTPVLILTAKKDELDRVLGLEMGADDYVTKPFSVRELCARVKSILRRFSPSLNSAEAPPSKYGTLEIDFNRYECSVGGVSVPLTSKEWELLKLLTGARGRALSRPEILKEVWGYDRGLDLDTRTVDQHIARLRDKLGVESRLIVTVKNVGYRFRV